MTQSIRDAAQALLSCPHCDSEALIIPAQFDGATGEWLRVWCKGCGASQMPLYSEPGFAAAAWNLRATVAAPQPTADERVAEHMRLVAAYGAQVQRDAFSGASLTLKLDAQEPDYSRIVAVEQSARALLSASQEDAKQQARLVELVLHMAEAKRLRDWEDLHIDLNEAISIAKAMSAKETK